MLSFRNRLLILLIGLVVGAQTVTLFTALARTAATERQRADTQLMAGAQIARQLLEYRERQLATAVAVLAADYGLREAVSSADTPTVASALGNHAARIGADLTLALHLDGQVLALGEGSAPLDATLVAALNESAMTNLDGAQFVASGADIYQVFVASVHAPDEVARVVLGFAVNTALARELRNLVGVEVAFVTNEAGRQHVAAATMATLLAAGQSRTMPLRDSPAVLDIGGVEYLGTAAHLSTGKPELDIAMFKPMQDVMAPFRRLAWNLGIIVGATLAAAIIAGVYMGRSAARPVQRLAAGAARIAAGDYSQRVQSSGDKELAHLADAFNSMQSGIANRESRLLYMARHDDVTGLPNRMQAEEWLNERLSQGDADSQVTIILLAATNLHEISASLGFDISERLIGHLSFCLTQPHGDNTLVVRIDGTHFAVLLDQAPGAEIMELAKQVHERARTPLTIKGISLRAAVVLGVATVPREVNKAVEALRCAEAAVETAFEQHLPIAYFERLHDDAQRRRLQLGSDLPRALQAGQLYLHYQPKVRMFDRSVCGVEALLRWHHPDFGAVSPAEFVPIAERTGASGLLTRWVLRSSLQQLAAWHHDGLQVDMAINLSATDILDTNLLQFILEALSQAKVPAGSLVLEITESVFLREPEAARRNMELLRVAGVRFSVDDFGTGYSSLSQLRELAVDELKIDQSFVRGADGSPERIAVIRAIIDIGRSLGLRTVAEGVESEAQWRMLADLGCDVAQGYLISAPVTASALAPLLHRSAAARDGAATEQTGSLRVLELRRSL
jgi:diguanylate cyclase